MIIAKYLIFFNVNEIKQREGRSMKLHIVRLVDNGIITLKIAGHTKSVSKFERKIRTKIKKLTDNSMTEKKTTWIIGKTEVIFKFRR